MVTASVVDTSTELSQPKQALRLANQTRLARAELKRDVYAGRKTAQDVLTDIPAEAVTMRVHDLLDAQKRWGSRRTQGFLSGIRVGMGRTCGELTLRQRAEIVACLDGKPLDSDWWRKP